MDIISNDTEKKRKDSVISLQDEEASHDEVMKKAAGKGMAEAFSLRGEEANQGREMDKTEGEGVTAASEARRKYDEAALLESQAYDKYYDDAAEAVRLAEESRQRKKQKRQHHRPMTAEQQIATMAALEERLLDFPVSPSKAADAESPLKVDDATLPETAETAQETPTKRRRGRKPKSLKPPRTPKRLKKDVLAEINSPTGTAASQSLVGMLAKLDSASTETDVQKIVDAAREILDNTSGGLTLDEEIRALVQQEDGWKEMARSGDVGLKQSMKVFMERYGIIPMGALEVAESEALGQ